MPSDSQETPPPAKISIPALYPVVFPPTSWFLTSLLTLLGGWRVEGREHVPRTGGVLIAANHTSYADPPVVGLAMPRRCFFFAKEPLFRIPVLRSLCRLYLAFPVKVEGAMDREALRHVENLLKGGEAVCIYPEGHVSRDGRLKPLAPGAAMIASRAGVPLVPAAVIGNSRAFPPPKTLPHFVRGGVTVRFGAPLDLGAMPPELGRREQLDWITAELERALLRLLPEEHHPSGTPEP